jgi:hypothetical protein
MISAGAVKVFFDLARNQTNKLNETLCNMVIHSLLMDAGAIRQASKCRAAEVILQVLNKNAENEFWEQRCVVLSICSRLLCNRSCGIAFVYGGLMYVMRVLL